MNSTIIDRTLSSVTSGAARQGGRSSAAPDAAREMPAVRQPEKAAPPPPSSDALQAATEQIESFLRRVDNSLQFAVDSSTGQTVVTVRNRSTGELVRQIPNEEVLRIAACLEDHSSALLSVVV